MSVLSYSTLFCTIMSHTSKAIKIAANKAKVGSCLVGRNFDAAISSDYAKQYTENIFCWSKFCSLN